jgi:hypothetical protein
MSMVVSDNLGRRVWATALTGIPFGIFKLGAGWYLSEVAGVGPLGVLLIGWGALDILLNVLSVPLPRHIAYCALANLGRIADRGRTDPRFERTLLAVDTLLAFLIVATMIWFRLLPELPLVLGRVWDVAVVCNIVGVGVERVWWASRPPPPDGRG